jgi:hypothetical protein
MTLNLQPVRVADGHAREGILVWLASPPQLSAG